MELYGFLAMIGPINGLPYFWLCEI